MVICHCNELRVLDLSGLEYVTGMCVFCEDPGPTGMCVFCENPGPTGMCVFCEDPGPTSCFITL